MFTVGLILTEMRGHFFPFLLTKTFSLAFLYQSSIFFLRFSSAISISTTLCDIFLICIIKKSR